MKKNKEFLIFLSAVQFVKGANRSLVCDIQRGTLQHIPNDLYDFYKKWNRSSLEEIYEKNPDDIKVIKEYIAFLIEREYAFIGSEKDLDLFIFDSLPNKYNYPGNISNAVFEFSQKTEPFFEKFVGQLDLLQCKAIQIVAYNTPVLPENILELIKIINNLNSITNVEFVVPYSIQYTIENVNDLLRTNLRIDKIIVHSCPFESIKDYQNGSIFIFTQEILNSNLCCGVISQDYFSLNVLQFQESSSFNSCLNKKISIDGEGKIKNCPSMKNTYGDIFHDSILEISQSKEFIKYWGLNKDMVETCKVCEYRYVCTDCRAYIEEPNNILSKPLKCGYNPFTNEWKDWTQNPLKKTAINYYGFNK